MALELGLVTAREPAREPSRGVWRSRRRPGRVAAEYMMTDGLVDEVRLFNVASYLHARDVQVTVPELGEITADVAYGGNFYAIVEPQAGWAGLDGMDAPTIQRLSPLVRSAVQAAVDPVHPEDSRIRGVSHVMWCDAPRSAGADARNAVFYGEKAIDRSPCETGSSARLAQLHGRGRLGVAERFVHESLIGTTFDCRIEAATEIAGRPAIRPSVAGWARITGLNTIFVDDRDPLAHGFQLR